MKKVTNEVSDKVIVGEIMTGDAGDGVGLRNSPRPPHPRGRWAGERGSSAGEAGEGAGGAGEARSCSSGGVPGRAPLPPPPPPSLPRTSREREKG